MPEEAAQVARGDVGLERPGRVGVAEDPGEIGNVLEQDSLVEHALAESLCLAIDDELHPSEDLQIQPGRGDDDVGFKVLARFQQDAGLAKGFDRVGFERGLTRAQCLEQVGTGHYA